MKGFTKETQVVRARRTNGLLGWMIEENRGQDQTRWIAIAGVPFRFREAWAPGRQRGQVLGLLRDLWGDAWYVERTDAIERLEVNPSLLEHDPRTLMLNGREYILSYTSDAKHAAHLSAGHPLTAVVAGRTPVLLTGETGKQYVFRRAPDRDRGRPYGPGEK